MIGEALLLALAQSPDSSVRITRYEPESRVLRAGDTAVSAIVIEHRADSARRVWVGYSVRDPDGRWFDVRSESVTLPPRRSTTVRKTWVVADSAAAGAYRSVMAVWAAPPEHGNVERLASAERDAAFRVRGGAALLMDEPRGDWRPADHALGRGRMRPDQVWLDGDVFRLRLLPKSCDGAEIRTENTVRYGEYSARMQTPYAPGSLSAFFLYGNNRGDENDEIDIEIFNDGTRRALLTAWIRGKQSRADTVTLPFDPAAAPHDYVIRWSRQALELGADSAVLARWTSGYPTGAMRLMANVWWPSWLECQPLDAPRELRIESIRPARR